MAARFGVPRAPRSVRALQKAGFYIHETAGSHIQLKHASKPGRVTVPSHQGFDLPKPIIKSIIRQAGLSNDEFAKFLDE
jgi:predicted RNA binding protein YcfA (HicA-like mRNA interferase family)